ncbi:hypothetical protein [Vibrio phage PhiImVa-1]|nr:hypothetical protein [Vibrio phage PhiImVa-1]
MFTATLNIAIKCVEENKTYEQYVDYVHSLELIQGIEILVIDNDAYDRVYYIVMIRGY